MPSSEALPPPARPPVCGMLMPILIGGCWAPTFEVSPSEAARAAPALAGASRRRRDIDPDLVTFGIIPPVGVSVWLGCSCFFRGRRFSDLPQSGQNYLLR